MKSRLQLVLLMGLIPAVIGLVTTVVILARMDHGAPSTNGASSGAQDDAHAGSSFASIQAAPDAGEAPLRVSLRAADLAHAMFGAVTKYSWDFGDGAKAEGVTAEHTYTQKGKYTVTLTIFYQDGTQQVDKRLIEVK